MSGTHFPKPTYFAARMGVRLIETGRGGAARDGVCAKATGSRVRFATNFDGTPASRESSTPSGVGDLTIGDGDMSGDGW
jgi:hypothetical protein